MKASKEKNLDPAKLPNPRTDMVLSPYFNFLSGEYCALRPVFERDHEAFIEIFTNTEAMKYFGAGRTLNPEELKGMVAKQASYTLALSPPRHDWALITKRTNSGLNEIVGKITVIYPKKNAEEQRTELSYCINPNYAGRGLATEGSKLVLESLKEELVATAEKVPDLESRKREFVATVHPKNIPSQKVLEKLGFEKDPKRQAGDKPGATVERPRNYYLLIPKPSIENNSMRSGRYVVM